MVTCVEDLTCGVFNATGFQPMEVFKFYDYQYGIPDSVILGIFLGILVAAIYLWTRSVNILVILGIYCMSVTAATWISSEVAVAYQSIVWILILGVASTVILVFLRLKRD